MCAHRSLRRLAGILGVLKAGGASYSRFRSNNASASHGDRFKNRCNGVGSGSPGHTAGRASSTPSGKTVDGVVRTSPPAQIPTSPDQRVSPRHHTQQRDHSLTMNGPACRSRCPRCSPSSTASARPSCSTRANAAGPGLPPASARRHALRPATRGTAWTRPRSPARPETGWRATTALDRLAWVSSVQVRTFLDGLYQGAASFPDPTRYGVMSARLRWIRIRSLPNRRPARHHATAPAAILVSCVSPRHPWREARSGLKMGLVVR